MAPENGNLTPGMGAFDNMNTGRAEQAAMVIGSHADTAQQAVTPRPAYRPTRKLPINAANLMLAALFAAGILCLYLLSLRIGPETASAEQQAVTAQVNAALEQMQIPKHERNSETDQVVNTFYYQAKQRQIPISELSGNPFVYHPVSRKNDAGPSRPGQNGDPTEINAFDAVKQLTLQSVLKGSNGAMAMISNDVLAEGQTVKGWTIKAIKTREVLLTRDGMEYTLRMPQ